MVSSRPLFIAEVSSNHHRDLNRCFQFIDKAKEIGCDVVKFQLFKIDQLFSSEILAVSKIHQQRSQWELPSSFIPKLAAHCRKKSIQFSCTPFYLGAVEELFPYVDFYKISSYELLWDELLVACAKTAKPIVLSTGMATLGEVSHAVTVLRDAGCEDMMLLHCVSGYPAPIDQCGLAVIKTLRDTYNCSVGWSDHSVNPSVLQRAVHRWGAEVIEFHLDLDEQGEEYGLGHCWLPDQMFPVIQEINNSFSADGAGVKKPAEIECADRQWRTDPVDGLRPLKDVRGEVASALSQDNQEQ